MELWMKLDTVKPRNDGCQGIFLIAFIEIKRNWQKTKKDQIFRSIIGGFPLLLEPL